MVNLKSYMQRQWSLVGGMAGTFREDILEMSINGIGTAGYPMTGYMARKTGRSVESGVVGFMETVEEKAAQGKAGDQDEKAFEMVGRGAPQEVKDAWMDAAKEVNANGMGIRGNKGKRDCEVDSWEFRL